MFQNMLKEDESLFLNPQFLDFDYQPKIVPFRENHQKYIAECIKPLFSNRSGKNLLITGTPGVGKTVSIRHVLNELREDTNEIHTIYVNCWKNDTPYKIITELCSQVGYKWTQNKKAGELAKAFAKIANQKRCVIVFDEADKIEEHSLTYSLVEDVYKSCLIFITNDNEFMSALDARIKSRLGLSILNFEKYRLDEVMEILKQRKNYAFVKNIWESEAFELIALKTYEYGDIRAGLQLMKEAGETAEAEASRRIRLFHSEKAVEKLKRFEGSDDDCIYRTICDNSGLPAGDIFRQYELCGGKKSYRTFQRKLAGLEKEGKVSMKEKDMGFYGRTRIIEKV